MNDYAVIIQARSNSKRLKGKILKSINGIPMIVRQYLRLKKNLAYPVIVATSNNSSDDRLADILTKYEIKFYRGSLNNLIKRYLDCCNYFKIKNFIRVGGDDPL